MKILAVLLISLMIVGCGPKGSPEERMTNYLAAIREAGETAGTIIEPVSDKKVQILVVDADICLYRATFTEDDLLQLTESTNAEILRTTGFMLRSLTYLTEETSKKGPVAQPGRALPLQGRCRRFNSFLAQMIVRVA